MRALGVTAQEIDIRPSAKQMLADIDHPHAKGEPVHVEPVGLEEILIAFLRNGAETESAHV